MSRHHISFFSVDIGYEVIGLERIPDTGPALLIYYHGALPIDIYYLMAKIILHKQRQLWAIGDRFLFKIPGRFILHQSY